MAKAAGTSAQEFVSIKVAVERTRERVGSEVLAWRLELEKVQRETAPYYQYLDHEGRRHQDDLPAGFTIRRSKRDPEAFIVFYPAPPSFPAPHRDPFYQAHPQTEDWIPTPRADLLSVGETPSAPAQQQRSMTIYKLKVLAPVRDLSTAEKGDATPPAHTKPEISAKEPALKGKLAIVVAALDALAAKNVTLHGLGEPERMGRVGVEAKKIANKSTFSFSPRWLREALAHRRKWPINK